MHSPAPMQNGAAYGMPMNNYNSSVGGPMNPGYEGVYNQPPPPQQQQNNYNMMPNGVQMVNQQMIPPQQIQGQNQMMNMYSNQPMPMPQQQMIPQSTHLMSPGSQQAYQQPGPPMAQMPMVQQMPNQGPSHLMNNQIMPNNPHARVMSPLVNQPPQSNMPSNFILFIKL